MLHIDARCFTEPLHVEISDENFSRSASSSSEWGGTHYRSMSNSMLRSRSSSLLPITNAPLKSPSSSFISPRRTSKGKSCFKPFLAFVAVCLLFGGVFLYTQQSSKAASLASLDGSELITEAAHRRKSSLEGGQLNWQTGAEDEGLVQALQAENDVVFDSSRLASKQQGHKQAATDPQYSAPKTRQPQQEAQHQGHTQAQQQLSDNIGQEQQQHGHHDQAYQAKQQQQQQQQQQAQQLVKAEASLLDPQQAQQQQQQQMAAAEQQAQQVAVQQQQAQQAEAHLLHAQHPPTEVPAPRTPPSLYDSGLSAVDIHGNVVHMSDLRGRVTLILNVASYCGYTQPNYSGLKEIYERYNAYGFEILAFPCNQFGNQEPGNAEEILHFVENHFQSKFPLMSKVDVNGPEQHPVFAFLKQHTPPMPGHPPNEDISWNFNKFLLDKWGHPMKRYASDLVQFEVETDVYNELIKPFPPATSTQ